MPRFSAHLTQLFTERPFAQRFAAAAAAGFVACEFRSPYEYRPDEVAQWLADAGLKNVLFNLPAGDWGRGDRGIAALSGRESEFRESVDRALEYAQVLGTPMLHVMAGIASGEDSRRRSREVFVNNLKYAAAVLAKHERVLLIEAINPRDVPGYVLTRQADAHSIREEVGAANLLVQMDLYHTQIVEGDLTTKLRHYLAAIGHIQVAGVPERHEPDDGEVNYPYVFRLLDRLRYSGWIGCEYVPRDGTEAGLKWMASALQDRTVEQTGSQSDTTRGGGS